MSLTVKFEESLREWKGYEKYNSVKIGVKKSEELLKELVGICNKYAKLTSDYYSTIYLTHLFPTRHYLENLYAQECVAYGIRMQITVSGKPYFITSAKWVHKTDRPYGFWLIVSDYDGEWKAVDKVIEFIHGNPYIPVPQ